MEHRVIQREEWGARRADGFYDRPVGNLERWLHHSVTIAPDLLPPFDDDYAAIRTLENIGQSRFKGGISYTFAITPAGLIFEGHSIGRVGAHTKGHNTAGAGIVLVGNYENTEPTKAALEALTWLLGHGVVQGWWKSPTLSGGHRDTKSTQCPGDRAYALIDNVNRGEFRTAEPVGNPVTPTPSAPTTPRKYKMHRLDLSNAQNVPVRDIHVDNLQGLLLAAGYGPEGLVGADGLPDGVAGAATKRFVGQAQVKFNTGDGKGGADYIVGDGTWTALIEY
jgi:N-acetylmuramoyl-L-alanine amidase